MPYAVVDDIIGAQLNNYHGIRICNYEKLLILRLSLLELINVLGSK